MSATHLRIKPALVINHQSRLNNARAAYHPQTRIPQETPSPESPIFGKSQPPARTQQLMETTHILESSNGQLVVPSVFDFLNLACRFVIVYADDTVDCVLGADTLDLVLRSQIQFDWIPRCRDRMRKPLDVRKASLKSVLVMDISGRCFQVEQNHCYPLCFILFPASGNGQGVFEYCVVSP